MIANDPGCNPSCRACHYKQLEYPAQLERKQTWALSQLGRWSAILREIRPAPESDRAGYRTKSWLRAHFQEGQLSFGMFRSIRVQGEWEKEFISWNTCPLHAEPIRRMIAKLREALPAAAPEFTERALVGVWMGSPHLVLISREPLPNELRRLDWSQVLVPPFVSAWFHSNPQIGRRIFGHGEIIPLLGESPRDSVHPIRAFRQVAQGLLREARALALEHLLAPEPELLLELYCGTGDLSLLLPEKVNWLGIELSRDAVQYANSLKPATRAVHAAYVGAVEQRLADPALRGQVQGTYSLYLNPPRSGLTDEARERVLALVREKPPLAIVYLSCSASSLSRDLSEFERAGYQVELLQPYDFFPQTEHFETLAVLRRP